MFLILLSSVYLLLCERIQASLLLKKGENVLRNILLEKLICCIKISEYKEEREILQDLKNKNKIDKNGKALTLQWKRNKLQLLKNKLKAKYKPKPHCTKLFFFFFDRSHCTSSRAFDLSKGSNWGPWPESLTFPSMTCAILLSFFLLCDYDYILGVGAILDLKYISHQNWFWNLRAKLNNLKRLELIQVIWN